VPVTGPEDLTPDAMAAIMSDVLARSVRFEQMTVLAYKAMLTGFGLADEWAQGLADMVTAQNNGIYDAEAHTVPWLAQPTSFRQWCEQQLKPAVVA
jgi:uncharacterized protein YbjT (DUF2867 family)